MIQFNSPHFLTGEELSQSELLLLLERAEELRAEGSVHRSLPLGSKTLALIFEKPSLRTRLSFTVGIQQLGGSVVELTGSQKKSEEPEDTIRVLQGMVDGVMIRTFGHDYLERMLPEARIPIINGLSDLHHPCQAIADLLTLLQIFGQLKGLKLAYIGDGNNVLHSLLLLAPFVGVDVHFSTPKGYEPDPAILQRAFERANRGGGKILQFETPQRAVENVHAIYTDVWTSMGFETENDKRKLAFKDFQLNKNLFSLARPDAIAMHCLPMVRGAEITSEIADHSRSAIFIQSENRLHAQKALLEGIFSVNKFNSWAQGKDKSDQKATQTDHFAIPSSL